MVYERNGKQDRKMCKFTQPRRKRLVCSSNNELLLPFFRLPWESVYLNGFGCHLHYSGEAVFISRARRIVLNSIWDKIRQ